MSTDVFAEAVLPGSPAASRDLVLTVDNGGSISEVARDHTGGDVVHCARDGDDLIQRIAQSTSVVIEHDGKPDPILLGPRPPDCPDDPWLTSVVACLLSVVPDLPSCCQLVSAALSRMADAPVTFARRPTGRAAPPARRGWGDSPHRGVRFQLDGHWVREVSLGVLPFDDWFLVVPDDLPDHAAVALSCHPLVADLAGVLRDRRRMGQVPADPPPVLRLISAVVKGDAGSFTAAAAALTQADVTVIDSDGRVVASSIQPERARPDAGEPASHARDILLRDESGLWGAVRLMSRPPALGFADGLLSDLGLVLVKSIYSERRRRTLESQLIVLSCLAGGDAERLFRWDCETPSSIARRLVVMRAPTAIDGHAGARLLDLAARAAARTDVLSGLCLVMSQGSLIGVYPDTGPQLLRHKRSWNEVLRALGTRSPLTVAVGAAVSDIEDFPAQHRLVLQIAKIQQSGSRYFDLPRVAMLDDLGPLAEVLGATPGRELVPFAERILGDLLDDQRFGGQLIETLYAYLQTSGSPREAGALLHLHPSTVKYRIRVIRELLGSRLEDQSARFDLELAVRLCLAARLLRKGPAR